MEHGSIVEQGSHDELLAAGGAYARLYESQFAAPLGAEAEDPEGVGAPRAVPRGADTPRPAPLPTPRGGPSCGPRAVRRRRAQASERKSFSSLATSSVGSSPSSAGSVRH